MEGGTECKLATKPSVCGSGEWGVGGWGVCLSLGIDRNPYRENSSKGDTQEKITDSHFWMS